MADARFTLYVSTTTLSGGVTVEAMIRKDIPAGICGPFTGSERLEDIRDLTPAEVAVHALEELRMEREFTAGEPRVSVGYDGLRLEFPLTKVPARV